MPKRVTKRQVDDLIVDVGALLHEAQARVGEWLEGIDRAITVDMTDDPDWKAVHDHLTIIEELATDARIKAEAIKGKRRLEQGMGKDLGDTSKERLRAQVVPFMQTVATLQRHVAEIAGAKR